VKLITPDIASPASRSSIDEDVMLLSRVACKDMDAFELLYRGYYRRLTRFLEKVTRRPQLTDEILDDTMLVVWRKAATFNGESRVSTWIFAIAYNKAIKALRKARDRVHAPPDADALASADSPETELIQRQASLRLKHQLARLSAEQRAVIELTYYYGYAYKEIAQIVGCPVDTVKTRMFHARRKLRAMLVAQGQEPF